MEGTQVCSAPEEMSNSSESGDNANNQDTFIESDMMQTNDVEPRLKDALRLVEELRGKCRFHAQQTYAWRRAHAAQELLVKQLVEEKNSQLSKLSTQLLLFESRLRREKKMISATLARQDATISRQQRVIDALTARLIDNGLETSATAGVVLDFDSQNDSDSAVVMEDLDLDFHQMHPYAKQYRSLSGDGITIARSISDAIDNGFKHAPSRRSNCYLRRPEVLETVYSVEEDTEQTSGDQRTEKTSAEKKREGFRNHSDRVAQESDDSDTWTYNTDKIPKEQTPKTQVTVYNRVMSNHRSVIKPKDVKYKRINKAKSKSLEELRGRLRNWVDKGNRHIPNLEQSQSYA